MNARLRNALTLLAGVLILAPFAAAQNPALSKDINPGTASGPFSGGDIRNGV